MIKLLLEQIDSEYLEAQRNYDRAKVWNDPDLERLSLTEMDRLETLKRGLELESQGYKQIDPPTYPPYVTRYQRQMRRKFRKR